MAGLDNVTSTQQTENTEDTTTQAVVKPVPAKGRFATAMPSGSVAMSPSILENMQRVLEEKEARQNSLAEGLKDVAAWFPGYGGNTAQSLATRANTKESNIADIFQMRNQIAQYQAAQDAQKRFEARRAKELGFGNTPQGTGTAVGSTQSTANAGPFGMSPEIRTALANTKTEEEWNKIYNPWAQKMSEMRANPEWAKEVEYKRQMADGSWRIDKAPLSVAYQYAMSNSNAAQANPAVVQSGNAASGSAPVSERNNNPGNLVDSTGKIRTFATREEGEKALDDDLTSKLSGTSPAYKQRFGDAPITPARLAETWAPAAAQGNSAVSTKNYGDFIAKKLGISPDQPIPNTPEAKSIVKQAITEFEAGVGSGAKPSTTVVPQGGAAPSFKEVETREVVERAGQEKFAQKSAEDYAGMATQIDKSGIGAGEAYNRATDILNIASDKDMQDMIGLLRKNGVAPFILKQLESGVQAGQFGSLGIKDLQKNLAEAGATKSQIEKFERLERNLANAELEWAKVYLKGQGAVSDAERALIRKAVGSINDPAKVLVMQAKIMQERAQFDKAMYEAYGAYRDKFGEQANFSKFLRTAGAPLIEKHNRDLSAIIGTPVSNNEPYKTKPSASSQEVTSEERKNWKSRYGKNN